MNEDIQKLLEIAINAPSGSNSQPWRFEVKGNQIRVIALPQKDHPILNYRSRGTLIAHGALLENIIIAAPSFGYTAEVHFFPEKNNPDCTASINLIEAQKQTDPLFSAIALRVTNRKKYQEKLLDEFQKQEFLHAADEIAGVKVMFVEDKKKRLMVGEALAANEIVTLENEKLHQLFFNEITWTDAEELQRMSGFSLKTMELAPPKQVIFKMQQRWSVMQVFNAIKFARLIAKGNAQIYASGAGTGILVVHDSDEDFLAAGRAMQRLWLAATQMKLSVQPITGTLFFWQGLKNNTIDFFSDSHKKIINEAYQKIIDAFEVKEGIVAFAFRVGFSDKPSGQALKKAPQITWE